MPLNIGEVMIFNFFLNGFNDFVSGERLGRGIVTDAITTPVVNTSAFMFKKLLTFLTLRFQFNMTRHVSILSFTFLLLFFLCRRKELFVMSMVVMETQRH